MIRYVGAYLLTAVVFFAIDLLWLGVVAPVLLVPAIDAVSDEETNRDFVAVSLLTESLDELGRRSAEAKTIFQAHPDLTDLAFSFEHITWYAGYDSRRGWVPCEFASDPEAFDSFDEEAEVPRVVRDVCLDEIQAPAAPALVEDFEVAGVEVARLCFRRTKSDPLSEGVLQWARLYWAGAESVETEWLRLLDCGPDLALGVLEHGLPFAGMQGEPRAVAPSIRRQAIVPLLEHPGREVRTHALTLT